MYDFIGKRKQYSTPQTLGQLSDGLVPLFSKPLDLEQMLHTENPLVGQQNGARRVHK